MTATNRLIVNTLAQNIRTVVNICLSLYSTRLVLNILGQSDYGIYMLVAGVVSFLSYFTNAMITTTQRHLSYSHGQKDIGHTKKIFANSYMINIVIGLIIALILVSLTSFFFNGTTLNIAKDKIHEAKWVYLIITMSVFFTFMTSPFKALLIARENIVYISIVDVLDGILKVALVFILFVVQEYRLVIYACIITFVMLFNLVALAFYGKIKYEECCIIPRLHNWNKQIQKDLLGFTTWTIYGSICIFVRTQGIAIILNRIYGTFINAAYGIAGQVLGSMSFLSTATINAFTPQIIKAEGANDRKLMLHLCQKACKYCYLLLAIVAIPVIFEMDEILSIWLGNAPDHASLFCRIFLISTIIDQLTTGLNIANQALGKIRNYTLLIYTTKLLTIPFVWLALKYNMGLLFALYIYIAFEGLTAIMRFPYIARTTGLQTKDFCKNVLAKIIAPTIVSILTSYAFVQIYPFKLRFLITITVCVAISIAAIWMFSLNESEKEYVRTDIFRKKILKK